MKRIAAYLLLVWAIAIGVCCSSRKEGARFNLTPEQLRLNRIDLIDTTTLQTMLKADSAEGRQLFDGLTARAWLLVDDSTGCVVSQKNARQKMAIASLTKMMTCLLVLENGNLNDTLEITKDVFIAKDSRVRLGDRYRMDHLLSEMMMQSDNDAAYALARHVGGDTLQFCEMMNQKAAYLGMDSTHFANPNGLPNPDNYSSAYDLMRLARYAMCFSAFADIVGAAEKDIPLTDGRHLLSRNTNALLTTYDGCIGIKTGFTREAGNCLASAATRNGRTLFLILLNSRSMTSRFTESAALLDFGFKVLENRDSLAR